MNNENTPALNVDFSHRLADGAHLVDSIGLMTDRALGILHLLSCQFDDDCNRLNDITLANGIFAAISEIEDIKSLSRAWAWHKAESTKNKTA
ncbi:MAG: hypothetical protein Q8S55_14335 [Methylococcaceae bacterium]|nr:hypothetical protein [Methylococcaceae bacterium]